MILASLAYTVLRIALRFFVGRSSDLNHIYLEAEVSYAVAFAILALITSLATWRYRVPREGGLGLGGVGALALSVAAPVVLLRLIPLMGTGGALARPVVVGFGITLVLAALGVALMAQGSRCGTGARDLGRDAALTLVLVGGWVTVIIGAVYLFCLAVTCRP